MARPTLSYLKNLILVLFGLPLGVLTGLTAIGNSVFAVPLVRSLLGLRPARTAGTALAATFFAALAAILSYQQHGDIWWSLALWLAVGQVVGAAWGERTVQAAPSMIGRHQVWGILVALGGMAMTASGLGLWPHHGGALSSISALPGGFVFWLWALVVAIGVGVVSRIIGLGGVLQVPAVIFLLGLSPHRAQGTALIVLLLAALPGALIHARRGEIEPQAGAWLSAGAIFGSLVGAWAAVQMPPQTLVTIFGCILALLGILMLWRQKDADAESRS